MRERVVGTINFGEYKVEVQKIKNIFSYLDDCSALK